ncbi:MAG: beta-propeller fold lactonase family protein [Spirochaetes bacterium]|nr:beta-propeller fold lactonase family protein [Spirochaetota bacterium]
MRFYRRFSVLLFSAFYSTCTARNLPAGNPTAATNSPGRIIPVNADCKATADGKICTIAFYLQPFAGTRIVFADNELKPLLTEKDKTLALTRVVLKLDADQTTATLVAENTKLKLARTLQISTDTPTSAPYPPLVFLDAPNSEHRFVRRIQTGKQPKSAMFISPTKVVLPLLDDNHSEVVDILTGERIKLTMPPEYAKRGGFVESVMISSLEEFWVSQMNSATIHRFAAHSLEYRGAIKLSGQWTKVLALNPVENIVYASNWNSADISLVSIDTLAEIKKIKIGGVPRGMAFSADGKSMLAAIFGGKSDSDGAGGTALVDLEKKKIARWIIKGGSHRHIVRLANDAESFAISDMMRSKVYFVEDNAKIAETKVYNNPNTIALSPDGKYLYVSCRGRNNSKSYLLKGPDFGKLMVVDTATHQVVESIEAGNQPTGLAVSPDGRYIVLTDFLDHALRVYERNQK